MQFIEAKDQNLAGVLTNKRYKIDAFQREYRWQRKQIEALISDLSICFERYYKEGDTIESYENYDGYYMGPIVLCEDKRSLSVIDGQQRLTSFTLLLIYLHHAQGKLDLPKEQTKDLKQFLYVTKAGKTTLVLNVEARQEVIEHLLNHPDETFNRVKEDIKDDESVRNIIERYEDITKLLPDEINNFQKLPIFIEWLLDKVIMVEVKAYSMENAYTIFETMNDRGLTLNPTEILKGYLLSKIENEKQSDEMNEFWRQRIAEVKTTTDNIDGDLDFFKAWLRAKYAITTRPTRQGAENEDFELIGTQFHAWVKNNPNKTYLKEPNDYYLLIRSDFDFYSDLYQRLYRIKNTHDKDFERIYISSFYTIADSLSYSLFISPISKIDDNKTITEKIQLVGSFIDIYTLNRCIFNKSITHSSIRTAMYDLVKNIRNVKSELLRGTLGEEINKIWNNPENNFSPLQRMDNWGFYHYLFARILYHINSNVAFPLLLRSKKKDSFILFKMFSEDERLEGTDVLAWNSCVNSIAGFCLVRRDDYYNAIDEKLGVEKIKYLWRQGYLPEMNILEFDDNTDILAFINQRSKKLQLYINKLLVF
ncbi:hypothetical protein EZS27_006245 [termite gut metagenome]|uniref:GmrSD restriction endonucleases N-terminal domain-containing protein n=1 Tax=termite gut metagenome TaxID=433724 RepID=A0A5J4SJD0_9ZZZZ